MIDFTGFPSAAHYICTIYKYAWTGDGNLVYVTKQSIAWSRRVTFLMLSIQTSIINHSVVIYKWFLIVLLQCWAENILRLRLRHHAGLHNTGYNQLQHWQNIQNVPWRQWYLHLSHLYIRNGGAINDGEINDDLYVRSCLTFV